MQQQSQPADPKEVSDAFFAMVETVQKMEPEELERLTEAEILELGRPILDATEGTTTLAKPTLEKLNKVLKPLAENIRSISRKEHQTISEQVNRILAGDATRRARSLESNDVRQILFNINGGATTMSATCEDLYDQWGGYVHLYPGDNLNLANSLCLAGSIFYVHAGTFYGQSVSGSKNENTWVGVGGIPVLNGQGSVGEAFSSGMYKNNISWMEIRNYTNYGIFSQSSSTKKVAIKSMKFKDIAPSEDGEFNGAITFSNCEDIEVINSYFEDVAAGVLFTDCTGPLKTIDNEALNPGRNFFQCDKCEGGGIRVNGNSLEHTIGYGETVLEDWINILESEGKDADYIQVNNNRARVILNNGTTIKVSNSGSMIMLGDFGGKNQEAKNNIGVNPGQVGIGVASGHNIVVNHNKMFSVLIDGFSNVAFYSWKNPSNAPNCSNHSFQNNSANWTSGLNEYYGEQKIAFGDGSCGTWTSQMGVSYDSNMNENIWNEW